MALNVGIRFMGRLSSSLVSSTTTTIMHFIMTMIFTMAIRACLSLGRGMGWPIVASLAVGPMEVCAAEVSLVVVHGVEVHTEAVGSFRYDKPDCLG